MSRRMSCALTIPQVRARTKTVTRRHVDTWRSVREGDTLTLIEKGMGLPKGARQVVLAEVVVRSNDIVRLDDIDSDDVAREGFDLTPDQFCTFWLAAHRHNPVDGAGHVLCRRIEWRYTT